MQTVADVNLFLIKEHCLLNKVTTVDVPPVKGNQKNQTFYFEKALFCFLSYLLYPKIISAMSLK